MLNFAFDVSEVIEEFSLKEEEVNTLCNYVLDRVVDEFMSKWLSTIDSDLNQSRDEYKRAIYTDRPDDKTAIIGLSGRSSKLAMMIETGADAFDEKLGFERSDKKHMKKDGGWYLTIPFRHGTSEAIMSMMVPGSDMNVLQLMQAGETMKQDTLPEPFNQIQTHEIQLNTGSLVTYVHKAPIYEGMHRRDIRSTDREKRGGYMTFRRVSDKSEEEAWMHPGFTAHNFMDRALQEADLGGAVSNAVDDWLELKGF